MLMAMNSTPRSPASIIRLTAFTPPPPIQFFDDGDVVLGSANHQRDLPLVDSSRLALVFIRHPDGGSPSRLGSPATGYPVETAKSRSSSHVGATNACIPARWRRPAPSTGASSQSSPRWWTRRSTESGRSAWSSRTVCEADELGHEILGGAEPDLGAAAELQAQVAAVRGDGDGLGAPSHLRSHGLHQAGGGGEPSRSELTGRQRAAGPHS